MTLTSDLATLTDRVKPVAQAALVDNIEIFGASTTVPGVSPAFKAVGYEQDMVAGNFIQRPNFRSLGDAVRQDPNSATGVDSLPMAQGFALEPVLPVRHPSAAWFETNARRGGGLKQFALNYARDAANGIASYLKKAYFRACVGAAGLNANHSLNRSGGDIVYQDIITARDGSLMDGQKRFRTLICSSRQAAALKKTLAFGDITQPAVTPLGNAQGQEINMTGSIAMIDGMRLIIDDGIYVDAQDNDYAILLATDTLGNPGSGIGYVAAPEQSQFDVGIDTGILPSIVLSFAHTNDYQDPAITALASMLGTVWIDKARFASGTPNPTHAELATVGNWTADYVSHKELPVAVIRSQGTAN